MSPRTAIPLLVVSFLLWSSVANAGDPVAAENLFQQSKQLMSEGRYADACSKFEESQTADPGIGTQFHLADCLQNLGQMSRAYALFRVVESEARALGQVGRMRVAHDRATALEQTLSKIVVVPQADVPGLHIRRDGIEVGRNQWDSPIAVDAGVHVLTATAPNKQAWTKSVDVPPYGNVVTVEIPPLVDASEMGVVADTEPAAASGRNPSSSEQRSRLVEQMDPAAERPAVQDRAAFQRGAGWFFIGAGALALGGGAYFGSKWLDDRNSSNAHCMKDSCDSIGTQMRNNASTEQRYAGVLLAGGGAAILGGTLLAVTAPAARIVVSPATASASPKAPSKVTWEIAPVLAPHAEGVQVRRAW